jgi:hypothetical protein
VPGQIVIAFVAELKVYEFWRGRRLFAELWRILEKKGALVGSVWQRAVWIVGIGGADRMDMGIGSCLLFGLLGLVLVEPAFQEGDGGAEVMAEGDE